MRVTGFARTWLDAVGEVILWKCFSGVRAEIGALWSCEGVEYFREDVRAESSIILPSKGEVARA